MAADKATASSYEVGTTMGGTYWCRGRHRHRQTRKQDQNQDQGQDQGQDQKIVEAEEEEEEEEELLGPTSEVISGSAPHSEVGVTVTFAASTRLVVSFRVSRSTLSLYLCSMRRTDSRMGRCMEKVIAVWRCPDSCLTSRSAALFSALHL